MLQQDQANLIEVKSLNIKWKNLSNYLFFKNDISYLNIKLISSFQAGDVK